MTGLAERRRVPTNDFAGGSIKVGRQRRRGGWGGGFTCVTWQRAPAHFHSQIIWRFIFFPLLPVEAPAVYFDHIGAVSVSGREGTVRSLISEKSMQPISV